MALSECSSISDHKIHNTLVTLGNAFKIVHQPSDFEIGSGNGDVCEHLLSGVFEEKTKKRPTCCIASLSIMESTLFLFLKGGGEKKRLTQARGLNERTFARLFAQEETGFRYSLCLRKTSHYTRPNISPSE